MSNPTGPHTATADQLGEPLGLSRRWTSSGIDVYELFVWDKRDARIHDFRDGSVAFEQMGVEVPADWSVNASNILAQKYFRGTPGAPERESSLRAVVDRVVDTITAWGISDGYFHSDTEAEVFRAELKYLIVSQRAAFNSPVWFNIGVPGVPQQASACFILSVEDEMPSILNWYVEEGIIFKGGSGAGVNLSPLRSSAEGLKGGGTASGPVSFMRGADASAGTIKSGGKTRRAAKMVILDVDHPDIEEFIWCKAKEEKKARALRDAGFDMDLDGADSHSIQYQNANNSVRISDDFMRAVVADANWHLRAVTTGEVTKTVRARDLFREISQAGWECADPGVQFDTTINQWHTTPSLGRINGSNPCSEYMHIDDSACNLASLNLLAFQPEDEGFDIEGFIAAVELLICAQEIIVGRADYPTKKIGDNTRRLRQLGLGYANLGALLMAAGVAYDSEQGRSIAAAVTALMGGAAYNMSARLAARVGAFEGYEQDADVVQRVLGMHRSAAEELDTEMVPGHLVEAARAAWDDTCVRAAEAGVRNAQATVLAPTGTISFLMDCDTTGIEPDLGLVKTKKLVGGGTMQIVNATVPRALTRLGYGNDAIERIVSHIEETGSVLGSPDLATDHVSVFACSMGDNVIAPMGHVQMMAAVQPFLSGAISKTVNLPESTSVEEVEEVYLRAWELGLKAVALYRDNCKVAQPLTAKTAETTSGSATTAEAVASATVLSTEAMTPVRERLPKSRRSRTFEFRVADCKGFVTVGEYDDGRPGELFIRVSKQGSTLAGIMDAFAISVSHGLQYGVPLEAFVDAFVGMRFEPAGMTDDPDLRIASSLMDYLFRRMAVEYMPLEERHARNILTTGERSQPTLPGVVEATTETSAGLDLTPDPPTAAVATVVEELAVRGDAPFCGQCGTQMVRAGSCYACRDCGSTSGCS